MDVVYLASCAVKGKTPDGDCVAGMDLKNLYTAAERHLLTAITAMALECAGVSDELFIQAKGNAIRKVVLFDIERDVVLSKLEEAGIWYMPLKGSVLKDCYPRIGMRQMADNDILFDAARAGDLRTIMESLGFTTERFGVSAHDIYHKPPLANFEMHRALFNPGSNEAIYSYYLNIRDKMIRDEGTGYGYHLSPEDFYLYMIAHEYKHYAAGGTGLRSLLDTYVYLTKKGDALDWPYIAGELDKLEIAEFEAQNRALAFRLFDGEELTEPDREML
ncbi:MAG: nucleotidyltransferase family protein, partial [Clostridia bacterium]|nr:nucleotidyltransferase family protein [Clostridia bacterium]